MVYSPRIRAAVGAVREALASCGMERQSPRFARHGEHAPEPDAPLVLVACSGGRDSMALAAVAGVVCASLGVRCGAAVVDHGLQPGSDQVARQAARRCERLGLDPVTVRTVRVEQEGDGLEAAARRARYQALSDQARRDGAVAVLLAHTRDDQAETVLMGLLRSGGIDAVAGMPESFERGGVRFIRPLLGLGRDDTTGICRELGLGWWDDPTNGDDATAVDTATDGETPTPMPTDSHGTPGGVPGDATVSSDGMPTPLPRHYPLRSRVRHDLMPLLRRFAGSDVAAHLARQSRYARLDKSFLDGEADRVMVEAVDFAPREEPDDVVLTLRVRALERVHPAIRLRVIAHALKTAGIPCTSRQVEAVDRLIGDWHGQGVVSLSGKHSASRQKHVIRVCQDGTHENRRCTG